ncbi:MAG: CAAX prenyl protease-related protein [Planctomycetaceae bacterium]
MNNEPPKTGPRTVAHVAPLATFMAFLALPELLRTAGLAIADDSAPWWRRQPELWTYPVQTVATLLVLLACRKHYEFRPLSGFALAIGAAAIGIAIWIAPGFLFDRLGTPSALLGHLGFVSRTAEYPPYLADPGQVSLYWLTLGLRLVRLVIAVPLAEEIFWRGFLMRYLAKPDGDYWTVPFGTFHRQSLLIVTAAFVLIHARVDWFPAAVFGLLMYAVAVHTKSLAACVIMHAIANLLLGIYVLATRQWGYW